MSLDYDLYINQHLAFLYLGIALTLASIVLFETKNNKLISIFSLLLGALSIRFFISSIDPFLHTWDEQFHALVAKNMMSNPFKPLLLVDPVLPYDFENWTSNHIWLHKQPLFLWQMALSMKIFGVNELAVRLPSILMNSLMVIFIYRIGKIAYSKNAGFYAAVLFTSSTYIIELISGRVPTDHNDIAFLFYVTASFWAWFEYEYSGKKYWLLLIGLFSGFSILVKWLTGLLVYSGWGLSILLNKSNNHKLKSLFDLSKSLLVSAIVVLPWQIYTIVNFPAESHHELFFNSLHFFDVVEGHTGSCLFHFQNIESIYGTDFHYIIIFSIILFLFIRVKFIFKTFIITIIIVTYLFFTLATTKLVAYTIVTSPLIYIIVGIVICWLFNLIQHKPGPLKKRKLLFSAFHIVIIFFLFFHFLNHQRISLQNLEFRKIDHVKEIENTLLYKKLPILFSGNDNFYFNAKDFDFIKINFYTNSRARKQIPSREVMSSLKNKGFSLVVFDDGKLPGYIITDSTVAKLKSAIYDLSYLNNPVIYY